MIAEVAAGDATTRGAVRFFWIWLTLATSVSVAGNVAHAVLTAPSGTVRLAAAAAVVIGNTRYRKCPNSRADPLYLR
jgi:hypothetical protein